MRLLTVVALLSCWAPEEGGRPAQTGQPAGTGPFVAHDSAETLRIGCVCFGEETPKQRLKHSYPQERGEMYLFFSAFVKCSE